MELSLPDPSVSSFKALLEYLYMDKTEHIEGFKMALSIYLNVSFLSMDTEGRWELQLDLISLRKAHEVSLSLLSGNR